MIFDRGSTQDAVGITRELVARSGEETSERFEELFGELLAIAASSRVMFNEPPLTQTDIRDFLTQSWVFLNSFRHA